LIDAYAEALAYGKARWLERDMARGAIGAILRRLGGRTRKELLDRRTILNNGKRKLRIDDEHALKASDKQRTFVKKLIEQFAHTQPDPRFFKLIDVARRVAGTGSLGLERYVILVAGKGGLDQMRLLDLKHARASSSVQHVEYEQPEFGCEADRVIAVQTRCQAVSPAFLNAIRTDRGSFVLRELQPIEDRLDLVGIARDPKGIAEVLRMMGSLIAWDQLRASGRQSSATADDLIKFGTKTKWRRRVLDVAVEAADQNFSNWQSYAKTYDEGGLIEQ
jgi:uncharacterized protein (DUF2252 family)